MKATNDKVSRFILFSDRLESKARSWRTWQLKRFPIGELFIFHADHPTGPHIDLHVNFDTFNPLVWVGYGSEAAIPLPISKTVVQRVRFELGYTHDEPRTPKNAGSSIPPSTNRRRRGRESSVPRTAAASVQSTQQHSATEESQKEIRDVELD